jgi:predicted 2-oxoglutarate/Fe(II)-dependent dioxygenase YbiX
MSAAPRVRGTLAHDTDLQTLDERVRKVWCADVGSAISAPVLDAFWRLKPELESHFSRPLTEFEGPDFLIYEPGAFYRPHLDNGTHYQRRSTSVVLFLNGAEREPAGSNGYAGGELTFYGLVDGAQWANCPIPVTAAPGLLVAFPSATLHEVRPVTAGRRCSVVGWFGGPS